MEMRKLWALSDHSESLDDSIEIPLGPMQNDTWKANALVKQLDPLLVGH